MGRKSKNLKRLQAQGKEKKLVVYILVALLLSSFVIAYSWYEPYFANNKLTSTIGRNAPATVDLNSNEKYGVNITVLNSTGLINVSVQNSSMTGTTGYLYSGNDSILLKTCEFSGSQCVFNYRNLSAGTSYYILVGSSNATWGGLEASAGVIFPLFGGRINFTRGAFRTGTNAFSGDSTKFWNILNITTGDLIINPLGVDIVSESYSSVTYPLYNENFIINFTYNSSHYTSVTANLIYNNVSYAGSKSGTGDNIKFTKTLTIPTVTSSTIYPFYWQMLFVNATGSNEFNYTHHNQTVTNIGFGSCSPTSVPVLNYFLKDEETQAKINGTQNNASIEVAVQVYSVDGSVAANFSTNFSQDNIENATICAISSFLNSSQYRLYADVRYYADGYKTQFNYIQNYTVNDTTIPKNITLYDLKSSSSVYQFKITFKDENNNFVENAVVDVSRRYTFQGVYRSVKMIKTEGTAGIGATFLDTSGVEYAFTVTKNGELLGTFYNIPIICEDIISQKCELNLYASLSTSYMFDFSTEDNLAYTIDFNETTRTITIIFSTLDNSASTIQLNVTKYDNYENLSLCSNSVTSSSGTLVCSIASGYGNLSIIGKLYKDSTLVTYRIYTIAAKAKDILGNNTFFFVFMIFIILPLLLISSPIGALVMGAIGIILAIVLFGISTTLIGTASFLGFLLVIIIIVIAKWVQRGND